MIAGLTALPLAAQSTYPDPNRDQNSPSQMDQRNMGEPGTGMRSTDQPGTTSPGVGTTSPGYGTTTPGVGATDRTWPDGTTDMGRTSPVEHREGFNWGWLGLLGLAGLAGMRHRHNHRHDHDARDVDVRDTTVDRDRI
jgi:MYXO-CTERM domain-containing protein